jgi:uncharacterized protein YfiM (DUF2279 family)
LKERLGLMTLAALLAAGAAWAHHSPSAEFNMEKQFTLTGTLTKVDWINPHIMIYVDAKGEDWRYESNPPAWFRRVGVGRADFASAIGKEVTIQGVRARDGSRFGYMFKITLADGRTLELVNEEK